MRKHSILIGILVCAILALFAEEKILIHLKNQSVVNFLVTSVDSIKFANADTQLNIHQTGGSITNFSIADIDSITFAGMVDTVKISFTENSAVIENPLENKGVTIARDGAHIIVNSTTTESDVVYLLKGTSSNGSFKIYSNLRFGVLMNGLHLTNSDGPALNIQSNKRIAVTLADGSTNSLTDAALYALSNEDQKATFFSEGQLVFGGSGILNVKSFACHAICSDDYIQINSGTITVSSAGKDGIHSNDYFKMLGGSVSVTASGDGIECESGHVDISGGSITTINAVADSKAITCDSTLTISGGVLNLTVTGDQSKGLKSKQAMTLSGGTITINTSGAASILAMGLGFDVTYCTAIKCGTNLNIAGSIITVISTGVAGKGISADGNLEINAGTVNVTTSGSGVSYVNALGVTDSYASACLEADGDVTILGGSITAKSTGSASKGISADGKMTIGSANSAPIIKVTNEGVKLLVSGTSNYSTAIYSEPKAIKSDGDLTINNGTFTLLATQAGANGIDGDATVNVSGGTIGITLTGNQSKGIKATGTMNLNGGNIIITTSGAVVLENLTAATFNPSYCTSIKGNSDINIGGSAITITTSGAAAKGITSDTNINMTAGVVKVTCTSTGSGVTYKNALNVTDAYNSSCFTADANVTVLGGSLTCSNSGPGGKALSADGTITVGDATNSPTLVLTTTGSRFVVSGSDYCHPKTFVATGAIIINNGSTTITSTDDGIHSGSSITINGGTNLVTANSATQGVGEGVESPIITFNGGVTNITASNDGINATYGTVSGGTESNDNSYLYVKGGVVIVAGADAVDSNGNIQVTGGTMIVNGPASGVEEGFDYNGTFNINGGTVIAAGSNSNMTKAMSNTSTQPGMYLKSSSLVAASGILHIENSTGTNVITVKLKNGGYYFHASSGAMTKGATYKIYTGGTYTGGSFVGNTSGFGLYTGGTYSTTGATLKATTTLSSTATVNTISF